MDTIRTAPLGQPVPSKPGIDLAVMAEVIAGRTPPAPPVLVRA